MSKMVFGKGAAFEQAAEWLIRAGVFATAVSLLVLVIGMICCG